MSDDYHITEFDNFHPGECWLFATYPTAEAAIIDVKRKVDAELIHEWPQLCRQNAAPTLEDFVAYYKSFAETPVAFDKDGKQVFDTFAYVRERAAAIMDRPTGPIEFAAAPPARSALRRLLDALHTTTSWATRPTWPKTRR